MSSSPNSPTMTCSTMAIGSGCSYQLRFNLGIRRMPNNFLNLKVARRRSRKLQESLASSQKKRKNAIDSESLASSMTSPDTKALSMQSRGLHPRRLQLQRKRERLQATLQRKKRKSKQQIRKARSEEN